MLSVEERLFLWPLGPAWRGGSDCPPSFSLFLRRWWTPAEGPRMLSCCERGALVLGDTAIFCDYCIARSVFLNYM